MTPLLLSLLAYVAAAPLAAALGARAPRASIAVACAPHVMALIAVGAVYGQIIDGEILTTTIQWAPELDLTLSFALDGLSLVMVSLIAFAGILVILYAAGYSGRGTKLGPLLGGLVFFAAAMQLLVVADDILMLFVGWELTSITSFGLIAQSHHKAAARNAARQALVTTGAGGLALLAGLVVVGQQAGTWRLSELMDADLAGGNGVLEIGVALVVLGAVTKSAQVPFSTWLPGAMAAPTPVSAYLHSATMVKAGIYLLLRFSPVLENTDTWTPMVVAFGCVTLVTAGWKALQADDAKALLAWSTVSQLGLLVTAIGVGGEETMLGVLALLIAHALAKAGLFMGVGAVDVITGTRDVTRIGGVWRQRPVLGVAMALCGASLAGIPVLAGFVAKEAVLEGLLHEGVLGTAMAIAVAAGSLLTVAYTLRLLRAGLGEPSPEVAAARGADPVRRALLIWPAAVLGALSLLIGWFSGVQDGPVGAALGRVTEVTETPHLYLWHGFNPALGLSALAISGGIVLIAVLGARHAPRLWPTLPSDTFVRGMDGLTAGAKKLSGVTQSGSLPIYLTTMLTVLVIVPGIPLLAAAVEQGRIPGGELQIGDTLLALAIAGAAIVTQQTQQRSAAILSLGAVGFGIALIFVRSGAPDLALTQLVVETLSLMLFVLALRDLPARFGPDPVGLSKSVRWIVSGGVGALVTTFVLVSSAARTATPPAAELIARAQTEGGGKNVVNVILTDIRALDTLGEITVLLVAAIGIVVLVGEHRRGDSATHDAEDLLSDGTDGVPARASDDAESDAAHDDRELAEEIS